ncbi:MAG: hypothetical protein QM702_20210 [Rubrivivax sp.]
MVSHLQTFTRKLPAGKRTLLLYLLVCAIMSFANAQEPAVAGTARRVLQSVSVEGNKHTRTYVILREINVPEGQSISADSVPFICHLAYQRLYNLNLFSAIEVQADTSDPGYYSLLISLKEQWFLLPQADLQLADRNFNVWWEEQHHALDRINLGIYVQHKNVTGNLDRLTLSVHAGYTQQLTGTYTFPYLDRKQKHGIALSGGYSRSRELAYATVDNKLLFAHDADRFIYRNSYAAVSWIYRPAYAMRHIVSLGLNSTEVGDSVVQLNPAYFEGGSRKLRYAELAYRFEYNGVDNWNYPRKGVKLVSMLNARYGQEGMQQQILAAVEFGYFKRLPHGFLASLIVRGRTNFGGTQPYALASGLGYKSNVVRGYEYYVVEAQHFGIVRCNLKYELVHKRFRKLGFRYLPEIPLWIYPKVFFDAGYAANNSVSASNTFANRVLYSAGVGVDIITAYDLKLRIEFAWNHLGENGIYLHANSE